MHHVTLWQLEKCVFWSCMIMCIDPLIRELWKVWIEVQKDKNAAR